MSVPSEDQLASGCGGCLESLEVLSSTGSLQFTTLASGKGERWGWWWENVPLETCTNSPGRLHQLPAGVPVSCKHLPPPPLT